MSNTTEKRVLWVNTPSRSYDVTFWRGGLAHAEQLFDLNRKVLVVTDDGVPPEYAKAVADACADATVCILPAGEKSKSLESLQILLAAMQNHLFDRYSCVVAVGGGMVGDLAGFAASVYMRGIDFYNIPTTTLAQIDSSVGGKTAVNFGGVKNSVGAFYQPCGVLIDFDLTATQDKRQFNSGLVEAVKMGCIYDKELFERFLLPSPDIEEIIYRSVCAKAEIVAKDETEQGLRKILNFGHTIGHGYEAAAQNTAASLTHGESVALGMLAMADDTLKEKLTRIFEDMDLPTVCSLDKEQVYGAVLLDKKKKGDTVYAVLVKEIGSAQVVPMPLLQLKEKL